MLTKTDDLEERKPGQKDSDVKKIGYFERLLSRILLDAGYHLRAQVIRASDYGDPQNRKRVIILAAKEGRRLPDFPKPTHFAQPNHEKGELAHVTVKDALEDLASVTPDTEGGNGPVQLPNGTFTDNHCIVGKRVEKEKLEPNAPSNTVRRTNGIDHYSQDRTITVREMARLQSFPDDYQFCGSATQKKSQIGNSVPVGLATALAKSIHDTYL